MEIDDKKEVGLMEDHDTHYKIGEVSNFLDISIETLRYYEKMGIVSPRKDPRLKLSLLHNMGHELPA